MDWVDTAGDARIALYSETFLRVAEAHDPWEILRAVVDTVRQTAGGRAYIRISTRGLDPGQFRITRLQRTDGSDVFTPIEWGASTDHIPVLEGGIVGESIRGTCPKAANRVDLHADPVLGAYFPEICAVMAVPLYARAEPGDWLITVVPGEVQLTAGDVAEAVLRANLVGASLANLYTAEALRAAQAEVQRQVDQIAALQQVLLGQTRAEVTGLDVAASYATFDRAGGDYFRMVPLDGKDDGRWAVFIGDAAGHGAAAAVVTALLHALFDRLPEVSGPADVLTYLNRHLCNWNIPQFMVTAFCTVYDPVPGRLIYARAGHDYPLFRDGRNRVVRLTELKALPLGVSPSSTYSEAALDLPPQGALFLYTDGITEAASPQGEQFGLSRLEAILAAHEGGAASLVATVQRLVKAHLDGRRPHDDQTLVVLCRP